MQNEEMTNRNDILTVDPDEVITPDDDRDHAVWQELHNAFRSKRILTGTLDASDKSVTFSNNRDIIEEADKKDLEWLFRCGNIRDGDVNNSDDYYKYNNYGNNILFMRASGVKIIRQVRHMTHVLKHNKIFKFKVFGTLSNDNNVYQLKPIIIWELPR